ncbi:hypothetical protein HDZ31DRAFT_36590 [Schizophyllum fasciatum]
MVVDIPVDLHRLIFEMCAYSEPQTLPTLVLVSRSARSWTNPILYSVVTLWEQRTAELFLTTLEAPSSAHHASLVRSLCLTKVVGHRRALRILALCLNLTNLACWISHPDLYPILVSSGLHSPTTLSLSFASLFRDPKRAHPDFASTLFARVTHLEFKDEPQTWAGWTGFRRAPRLTHLAFACHLSASTADAAARAIRGILESCNTSLRVLLVLAPSRSHWRQPALDVDDPRLVHLTAPADGIADWENLARGDRNNIWTLAEDVVAKRTRYEVDVRSTNPCFHSQSNLLFGASKYASRYVLRYILCSNKRYNVHIAVTQAMR